MLFSAKQSGNKICIFKFVVAEYKINCRIAELFSAKHSLQKYSLFSAKQVFKILILKYTYSTV